MRLLMTSLVLAAALTLGARASAESVEKGRTAFENGNYAGAFEILDPFSKAGNAEAKLYIALMYKDGLGIERDVMLADYYLSSAAFLGNTEAQYEYARVLEETPMSGGPCQVQQWEAMEKISRHSFNSARSIPVLFSCRLQGT